jgi:predicted O-methyltransferase YrrM
MKKHLPENNDLRQMLTTGEVILADGSHRPITSATSTEECIAMAEFLRHQQPEVVVEVGTAYGVSALTILTALRENGKGRLISIDPYHRFDSARRSMLAAIERSGLGDLHRHMHMPSELALPNLLEEGIEVGFTYIDGHHGFDHAFVDFFYADKLSVVGSVIAFDDSAWRSVHRVIRYLMTHREYRELDMGLQRTYASSKPLLSLVKRIQNRFGPSRYMEKTGNWTAPWNFYRRF